MLLALTGGIATGKSTFRGLLADRYPFTCFDADSHVHSLMENDGEVRALLQQAFGHEVTNPGPAVNRRFLRQRVFSDPAARSQLEAIIHPRVRAAWLELRARCRQRDQAFLADIPLLFETEAASFFDVTVTVAASPAVQHSRMKSRGLDDATIQAMLASQLPMEEKVRRATVAVWNDGSIEALGRQADLLVSRLRDDAHQPPHQPAALPAAH
jgi:dephospho-CoA kinase